VVSVTVPRIVAAPVVCAEAVESVNQVRTNRTMDVFMFNPFSN
jgi:hypothetical protein